MTEKILLNNIKASFSDGSSRGGLEAQIQRSCGSRGHDGWDRCVGWGEGKGKNSNTSEYKNVTYDYCQKIGLLLITVRSQPKYQKIMSKATKSKKS